MWISFFFLCKFLYFSQKSGFFTEFHTSLFHFFGFNFLLRTFSSADSSGGFSLKLQNKELSQGIAKYDEKALSFFNNIVLSQQMGVKERHFVWIPVGSIEYQSPYGKEPKIPWWVAENCDEYQSPYGLRN